MVAVHKTFLRFTVHFERMISPTLKWSVESNDVVNFLNDPHVSLLTRVTLLTVTDSTYLDTTGPRPSGI